MLYNFIYMKCPEKVSRERQKVDYWLPAARGGEEGKVGPIGDVKGCIDIFMEQ